VANRRSPSSWITDQAVEWIDEMGSRPLFLFVHYYDIHSDYASLPEFEKLFVEPYNGVADGTGWQLQRANFTEAYIEMCVRNFDENKCSFGGHPDEDLKYRVDRGTSRLHLDEHDLQHLRDLYDAGVRQLDTEISRLLSHLRDTGIVDDTLLIVTSDHGEAFGEHGAVDHFLTTFQEVLHVPLMIRRQGIPANVRIAEPVSLVDLVPTILVQAGVPLSEGLDGRDLSPLWRGAAAGEFEQRSIFAEADGGVTWRLVAPGYYPEFRALRRGKYKLIYVSDRDRYMLFDLATDPKETHDLAAEKPELHAELRGQMERRYQSFDPEPTDETRVDMEQEDIENLRALGYIQ
jgi:arylsulfatase A-like enzyme